MHNIYRDRAGIDHKILAYGLGARTTLLGAAFGFGFAATVIRLGF